MPFRIFHVQGNRLIGGLGTLARLLTKNVARLNKAPQF
jgi:hypothetical protein